MSSEPGGIFNITILRNGQTSLPIFMTGLRINVKKEFSNKELSDRNNNGQWNNFKKWDGLLLRLLEWWRMLPRKAPWTPMPRMQGTEAYSNGVEHVGLALKGLRRI